jgi:sugar-phosphatase
MIQTIQCKAVLFDLDGVLVDSGTAVERAWREWAALRSLDPNVILADMHGRRGSDTIARVAPHLDTAAEARTLLDIELNCIHLCHPYPNAQTLFHALEGQPHAVVTSGEGPLAAARLQRCDLAIPDVFVTADQLTAGKPDPEGYLLAAERLGITPAACVVIEDSVAGLQAAHRAGMMAVGVATSYPAAALTDADFVVMALDQIAITPRNGALELTITTG